MSYKEFNEELKAETLKKVYLFHGNEKYLIEKFVKLAKDKYLSPNFIDFNFITFEEDKHTFGDVLSSMETLPFMDPRKIVVVYNSPFLGKLSLTDKEEDRFKALLESKDDSYTVFFISQSIDKRKKIVKTIGKLGKIIDFDKLNRQDYEKWILRMLKDRKLNISKTDLLHLLDLTGYLEYNSEKDLYEVENQLSKLFSYVGDKGFIEKTDLDAIFDKPIENNIFLLTDDIADQKIDQAILIFNSLINKGEAEIKILFMISRHFRNLNKVKIMLNEGFSQSEIAKEIKIPVFACQKLIKQSRKYDFDGVQKLLKNCLEADISIKTGKMNPRLALETLISKSYK